MSLISMPEFHPQWVKLDRYCEITGDTEDAVKCRIKRGKWLQGEQVATIDRRIWVNLVEVDEWRSKQASRAA